MNNNGTIATSNTQQSILTNIAVKIQRDMHLEAIRYQLRKNKQFYTNLQKYFKQVHRGSKARKRSIVRSYSVQAFWSKHNSSLLIPTSLINSTKFELLLLLLVNVT